MQIDEFLELVHGRRSIRQFKPDPVPEGFVDKIIEAGRWAMSGANGQPWEFIVVRNRETINKIAEGWLEKQWEQHFIEQTRIEDLRQPWHRQDPKPAGFKDAPVLIVVVGDRRTLQASVLSTNYIPGECVPGGAYLKNMANATQNLCLAATALGLGSQWVSVNQLWEHRLKVLLEVPPLLDIHTVIPIGYPTSAPKPPYRRESKDITHFEKYDGNKYRAGDDIIKFLYDLRRRTRPTYPQN